MTPPSNGGPGGRARARPRALRRAALLSRLSPPPRSAARARALARLSSLAQGPSSPRGSQTFPRIPLSGWTNAVSRAVAEPRAGGSGLRLFGSCRGCARSPFVGRRLWTLWSGDSCGRISPPFPPAPRRRSRLGPDFAPALSWRRRVRVWIAVAVAWRHRRSPFPSLWPRQRASRRCGRWYEPILSCSLFCATAGSRARRSGGGGRRRATDAFGLARTPSAHTTWLPTAGIPRTPRGPSSRAQRQTVKAWIACMMTLDMAATEAETAAVVAAATGEQTAAAEAAATGAQTVAAEAAAVGLGARPGPVAVGGGVGTVPPLAVSLPLRIRFLALRRASRS